MLLGTSASALLVVTRTLLGAPGIATRSKDATRNKCIATSNKGLTSGIATRSKDATRGSSNKFHRQTGLRTGWMQPALDLGHRASDDRPVKPKRLVQRAS